MSARKKSPWIKNQTEAAREISAQFGFPVTRFNIREWRKMKTPFPAPDDMGRINRSDAFAWMENYLKPNLSPGVELMELENAAKRAKLQSDVDAQLHEKWKHDQERGKFIDRDECYRTIAGALRAYHQMVTAELEQHLVESRVEKLQALNCTADAIAQFREFDIALARGLVDKIEKHCEENGKEP